MLVIRYPGLMKFTFDLRIEVEKIKARNMLDATTRIECHLYLELILCVPGRYSNSMRNETRVS